MIAICKNILCALIVSCVSSSVSSVVKGYVRA